MLPTFLCALAAVFLSIHLATLFIAWVRCRPDARMPLPSHPLPPITMVRPLCGIETSSAETLQAAFTITYPAYELFFCVARKDDPIVPMVCAAIAANPHVDAKLLVGDDKISTNPKLNNMVKGWRAATHDWIVFIDSNVRVTPDFLKRCVMSWRPDTGAVSAPPVGIDPLGLGGYLECAFLNTYEARWQYAVDTFGQGFAQGKTLLYRKADLDRTGLRELATEPAEDAATTKMVRRAGRRVRLAPPSLTPVGIRRISEVWSRQLRWARLRRATFLVEFLPEIFVGSAVPSVIAGAAAASAGWPVAATVLVYLSVWLGAELVLAKACRWPAGWRLCLALVLRDVLMPALWVGALSGSSYTWKGAALKMEQRRPRRKLDAQHLRPEEGI